MSNASKPVIILTSKRDGGTKRHLFHSFEIYWFDMLFFFLLFRKPQLPFQHENGEGKQSNAVSQEARAMVFTSRNFLVPPRRTMTGGRDVAGALLLRS